MFRRKRPLSRRATQKPETPTDRKVRRAGELSKFAIQDAGPRDADLNIEMRRKDALRVRAQEATAARMLVQIRDSVLNFRFWAGRFTPVCPCVSKGLQIACRPSTSWCANRAARRRT